MTARARSLSTPFQVQPSRQAKAGGQIRKFRASGSSHQKLQVAIQSLIGLLASVVPEVLLRIGPQRYVVLDVVGHAALCASSWCRPFGRRPIFARVGISFGLSIGFLFFVTLVPLVFLVFSTTVGPVLPFLVWRPPFENVARHAGLRWSTRRRQRTERRPRSKALRPRGCSGTIPLVLRRRLVPLQAGCSKQECQ